MLFYGLLAAATLSGFLGLGIISIGLLLLVWALTRSQISDTFPDDHRRWIKRASQTALIAHIALIGILVVKVTLVVQNNGEGWFSALLSHWLIDHIGEALISVWLTYKVIKGGLDYHAQRPAAHSGAALAPTETKKLDESERAGS